MNRLWKVRSLGVNVKRMMYEKIVVPNVLYGADTCGLKESEKKKLYVMEMKCLRIDRISNEVIRRRVGVQNKLAVEYRNVCRGGLDM